MNRGPRNAIPSPVLHIVCVFQEGHSVLPHSEVILPLAFMSQLLLS